LLAALDVMEDPTLVQCQNEKNIKFIASIRPLRLGRPNKPGNLKTTNYAEVHFRLRAL